MIKIKPLRSADEIKFDLADENLYSLFHNPNVINSYDQPMILKNMLDTILPNQDLVQLFNGYNVVFYDTTKNEWFLGKGKKNADGSCTQLGSDVLLIDFYEDEHDHRTEAENDKEDFSPKFDVANEQKWRNYEKQLKNYEKISDEMPEDQFKFRFGAGYQRLKQNYAEFSKKMLKEFLNRVHEKIREEVKEEVKEEVVKQLMAKFHFGKLAQTFKTAFTTTERFSKSWFGTGFVGRALQKYLFKGITKEQVIDLLLEIIL